MTCKEEGPANVGLLEPRGSEAARDAGRYRAPRLEHGVFEKEEKSTERVRGEESLEKKVKSAGEQTHIEGWMTGSERLQKMKMS